MFNQDPREYLREIDDDPKKSQDHDKEIQSEKDDPNDDYKYTDWASI